MIKLKLGVGAIVAIILVSAVLVVGAVMTDSKLPNLPAVPSTRGRGNTVILYASNSSNDKLKVKWSVTSNTRGVLDSSAGDSGDWLNSPFFEQYWLRPGEVVRVVLNAGVNFKLVSNMVICSVRTNTQMVIEDTYTKEKSSPTPDVTCPATVVNE